LKLPPDLQSLLRDLGASVVSARGISHGVQYRLEHGPESAILNVYSTGKVVAQGKSSALKDSLDAWAGTGGGSRMWQAARPALDPTPRLGTDEAGKGDYFGPLVVAGVRVLGGEAAEKLQEIGVRDSKTLSLEGARGTARRVVEAMGRENVSAVVLSPEKYETRRKAAGNVNTLLGEVNAEIIGLLQDEVEVVVVDEFARAARGYLEPFVPEGVGLEVRTQAEDDAAVAAASIVARARQLEEMERLSERVGFALPLGSTHVVGAARRVYKERGMAGLREVAKVSFRTTRKVTED
jgi:ribonuclease HIII